jgi:hypothetical protein
MLTAEHNIPQYCNEQPRYKSKKSLIWLREYQILMEFDNLTGICLRGKGEPATETVNLTTIYEPIA